MILQIGSQTQNLPDSSDQFSVIWDQLLSLRPVNTTETSAFWKASLHAFESVRSGVLEGALEPHEINLPRPMLYESIRTSFESFSFHQEYPWMLRETPDRVGIVFSGNVVLNGIASVIRAVAGGSRVLVRLSEQDYTIPFHWLAALAHGFRPIPLGFIRFGGPGDNRVESIDTAFAYPLSRLICYGNHKSTYYWSRLGAPTFIHGPGIGVAWMSKSRLTNDELQELVRDTLLFGQNGCLSTQFIFVEGGKSVASQLFEDLNPQLITRITSFSVELNSINTVENIHQELNTYHFRERISQVRLYLDPDGRFVLSMEPLLAGFSWLGQGGWLRIFYGDEHRAMQSLRELGNSLKSITAFGKLPDPLSNLPKTLYPAPGKAQSPNYPWPGGPGSEWD